MQVDVQGNAFIAATLSNTATLAGTTRVADSTGEMLLIALDNSGEPYWTAFYPGHENNELNDLVLDQESRLIAVGNYYAGVDFGRGPEASAGFSDVVVMAIPAPRP